MEDLQEIPYIVYEAAEARHERTVKRLTAALIVAVVLLFINNLMWLDYCENTSTQEEQRIEATTATHHIIIKPITKTRKKDE